MLAQATGGGRPVPGCIAAAEQAGPRVAHYYATRQEEAHGAGRFRAELSTGGRKVHCSVWMEEIAIIAPPPY